MCVYSPRIIRLHVLLTALYVLPVCLAQAAPDLAVTKTVDNPQPAAGQPVEFTIGVTNVGADAALSAQVQDLLPAGTAIPVGAAAFPSVGTYDPVTGIWTVGGLEPAGAASLVIPAIITDAQPPACIVNQATAADPLDVNAQNNIALAALRQPGVERCVDVSVSFIEAMLLQFGCDEMVYIIRVRVFNAGPDTARDVVVELSENPVVVTDLGFEDGQCTSIVDGRCLISELPPGADLELVVQPLALRSGSVMAQDLALSVSSADTDYEPVNNSATRALNTGVFIACPDIKIGNIGGPGCFIATAAYGSPLDPHVDSLRRFRDRHLITNAVGRSMVAIYYRYSPPLADYIAQRPWARTVARAVLTPLVLVVAYPGTALGLTLLLLIGVSLRWILRRRRTVDIR